MRLGEATLARRRRRHRQPGRLGELAQLVVALGNAHAVTGDDDRPLRGENAPGRRGDQRRLGRRRRGRQIEAGRIEHRLRVGCDRTGERVMAEQHRHRTGLSGHRVLDRELGRLHRGDRLLRLHDLLGHAAKGAPRVPAAIVAGRLLVGRVQAKARRIAEIGQEQHGRTRQEGLERTNEAVAEHPRALPEHHTGAPGQPSVNFGHHPGQRLFAHGHHADLVLHLREARDDAAGMPARYAEDIFDAGFRQDAGDQHSGRQFLGQHPLDRHFRSSPGTAEACLARLPNTTRLHRRAATADSSPPR